MAGFASATTLTKVAFIAICVGLLLFIIGFATDYWLSYDIYGRQYGQYGQDDYFRRGNVRAHIGLWAALYYYSDYWKAVQAMECIGLILGLLSLILLILYLFVGQFQGKKNIVLYSLLAAIAAGVFILIGIIIWGSKNHSSHLGWSFALACVGGIFLFIAGLMLIPEKKPGIL